MNSTLNPPSPSWGADRPEGKAEAQPSAASPARAEEATGKTIAKPPRSTAATIETNCQLPSSMAASLQLIRSMPTHPSLGSLAVRNAGYPAGPQRSGGPDEMRPEWRAGNEPDQGATHLSTNDDAWNALCGLSLKTTLVAPDEVPGLLAGHGSLDVAVEVDRGMLLHTVTPCSLCGPWGASRFDNGTGLRLVRDGRAKGSDDNPQGAKRQVW